LFLEVQVKESNQIIEQKLYPQHAPKVFEKVLLVQREARVQLIHPKILSTVVMLGKSIPGRRYRVLRLLKAI
jgi:hypothetical protein